MSRPSRIQHDQVSGSACWLLNYFIGAVSQETRVPTF